MELVDFGFGRSCCHCRIIVYVSSSLSSSDRQINIFHFNDPVILVSLFFSIALPLTCHSAVKVSSLTTLYYAAQLRSIQYFESRYTLIYRKSFNTHITSRHNLYDHHHHHQISFNSTNRTSKMMTIFDTKCNTNIEKQQKGRKKSIFYELREKKRLYVYLYLCPIIYTTQRKKGYNHILGVL